MAYCHSRIGVAGWEDRHGLVTKSRRTQRYRVPALLSIESVPDRDLDDAILTSRRAIDSLSDNVVPPGPRSGHPTPRTGARQGHKAQPELTSVEEKRVFGGWSTAPVLRAFRRRCRPVLVFLQE